MFADRIDAGRHLAAALRDRDLGDHDLVVLGLPRGGVPVAFEVARALGAPLDVIVVRKLGVPFQPEYGMGAIGEGGVRVLNQQVLRDTGVDEAAIETVERRERAELERRARVYRGGRPPLDLTGRTVVVVDDGIATGSTARAACLIARAHGARRVVLAVPVAPPGVERRFADVADDIVCPQTPRGFFAIGQYYQDFSQTTDDEVTRLLGLPVAHAPASDPPGRSEAVHVPAGRVELAGQLDVPASAGGLVVFAHGSGSSRHSPRNRFVASALNGAGLGTLLVDLLTVDEELDRANVFDIALLADRLIAVADWLRAEPEGRTARIGLFGASTGAGAALWAAAEPHSDIAAVVSRGGRPDLAAARLHLVRAPTLLIVGGADDLVLDLNRQAQRSLRCPNRLEIVPGATHLFEETGALAIVADLAARWFVEHLRPRVDEGPDLARSSDRAER